MVNFEDKYQELINDYNDKYEDYRDRKARLMLSGAYYPNVVESPYSTNVRSDEKVRLLTLMIRSFDNTLISSVMDAWWELQFK